MKVVTNGFTKVGNTSVAPIEQLDVDGKVNVRGTQLFIGDNATTQGVALEVGRYRGGAGSAQIQLYDDASLAPAFNFQRLANGISRLRHTGANFYDIWARDAAPIRFVTNSAVRMIVEGDGGVALYGPLSVAGGTQVTSDERTKKNVKTFSLGLDEIMKMNPIKYEYNGQANTPTDRPYVGLVAQELQKIAPDFVSNFEFENINKETGEVESSNEFLKIHDSELKYIIINAIKDQQKIIEDQAAKIAELEEAISVIGSTESLNNINVSLSGYNLAELDQNTPNPFNGQTSISYIIPTEAQDAQINIYGQSGQLMKTLDIEHVGQGTLTVNATDLPSGTYSYQLVVDGRNIQTNKMVLAK